MVVSTLRLALPRHPDRPDRWFAPLLILPLGTFPRARMGHGAVRISLDPHPHEGLGMAGMVTRVLWGLFTVAAITWALAVVLAFHR